MRTPFPVKPCGICEKLRKPQKLPPMIRYYVWPLAGDVYHDADLANHAKCGTRFHMPWPTDKDDQSEWFIGVVTPKGRRLCLRCKALRKRKGA